MYLCIYNRSAYMIHLWISTYTHIYIHAYTYRLMYVCQDTYLNIYIHIAYIHIHMCIYIHSSIIKYVCNMCIYGNTYTNVSPHMSAYIHVYLYAYINTYVCVCMYVICVCMHYTYVCQCTDVCISGNIHS